MYVNIYVTTEEDKTGKWLTCYKHSWTPCERDGNNNQAVINTDTYDKF